MPVFNNVLAGAAGQGGAGDYTIERSLRFDDAATSELVRLPSSGGDRRTFTISFWLKRTKIGATQMLLQTGDTYNDLFRLYFDGNDKFRFHGYNGSSYIFDYISTARFRDVGAWGHYVVSIDTNAASGQRVKAYFNGEQITDWDTSNEPYQQYQTGWNAPINQRIGREYTSTYGNYYNFNGYVAEFHNVDGQALDPTNFGEFSADTGVWNPIKYSGSHGTNGFHLDFANASDLGNDASGSNNFTATNFTGSLPVISSPNRPTWNSISNWTVSNSSYDADYSGSGYTGIQATLSASTTYHFYLTFKDTSGSYGGWYFTDSSSAPSNTVPNELGSNSFGLRTGHTSAGTHGSYATANGTSNGQSQYTLTALQSSGSTEHSVEFVVNTTVGKVWARKLGDANWVGGGDPSNSSSTASFLILTGAQYFGYMGYSSGTTADFATEAGSPSDIDSLLDSPTNYDDGTNIGGNYATLNPLESALTGINNGNLNSGPSGSAGWKICTSTMAVSSGRWYWEGFTDTTAASTQGWQFGFCQIGPSSLTTPYGAGKWSHQDGVVYYEGSSANISPTTVANDIIAYALDMDAGTCKLYVNNSLKHTFTGITGTITPFVGSYNNPTVTVNFGQRSYTYAPPSGYKPLCTQSFDDPLITDPSTAFDTKLWTGNGSALQVGGPKPSENATVVGGTLSNAGNAFNGSGANWATLAATNTSTAASVDFAVNLTGITRIEAAFDSPSGSGDTRGRYNGANAGNTRTGTGSGYSDIYNGSAITVTSVGFAINQNGTSGTSSDILSRFRITDSSGTRFIVDGTGDPYSFSPDLVFTKQRNSTGFPALFDTTRGVHNALRPHSTGGNYTDTGLLTAFNSDGFSIGSAGDINGNNSTYVGWAWDAGDLVTNSAYNQSAVWSSGTYSGTTPGAGYEVANAFNGSNSPGDSFGAGKIWGFFPGSGTLTLPTPITLTSSSTVEFYTWHNTSSSGNITVTCSNGSVVVTPVNNANIASTTVSNPYSTFGASITAITVNSSGSDWTALAGIVIDGKLLVDAGVIPIGGLNSSVYDQSQRWRDYLTSTQSFATNYGKEKAFDGTFTADGGLATLGVVTFTPPAMTVTSLEVNVYSDLTLTLPDGTNVSVTGVATNDVYRTVNIGSGFSFTGSNSITFTPNTGGYVYIDKIKINGKELVDDDVTVTNVPSIASTCRANPTAGFSITSWVGTGSAGSIGHGLQKKPELIITKVYSSNYNDNWPVYHPSYGAGTYTYFNSNIAAPASYLGFFNGVEPTSSVFTVGTANSDNTKDLIAYCISPVDGYSAVGSYEGNGSADGPFVFTGMRPRWILLKNVDSGGVGYDWLIYDTERDTYNVGYQFLCPNTNNKELRREGDTSDKTDRYIDILSNGFKIRNSNANYNGNGNTHIYAAFAENPFKYARAR